MKKFLSLITYFFENTLPNSFKKIFNKNVSLTDNNKEIEGADNVVITINSSDDNFYDFDEVDAIYGVDDADSYKYKNIQNPLAPFDLYVDWGSDYNKESTAKQYAKQGRPFTEENHKAVFSELISFKNFFSLTNTEILEKLWQDAKFVNDGMITLNSLGISYTLDITGGAARDFVLNKEIKDIDFMLSFPNFEKELHEAIENGSFYQTFSNEELQSVEWENPANRSQIKDKHKKQLVQLCLNRQQCINQVYFFQDERSLQIGEKSGYAGLSKPDPVYKEDRLISVIKLSNDKLNYPCDILLTDFIKPAFLEEFDFDLCKASFSFVNHYYNTKFPEKSTHLISRFIAERDFYADVYNKKLTYNSYKKSEYEIKASFSKHYKNIFNKFKEYEFNLIGDGHYHDLARSSQQMSLLEINLQENLPINNKPKKINKV